MNKLITIDHCRNVLNTETVIHADNKRGKSFTFNNWKREYNVWHKGECVGSGWELENMLKVYNGVKNEKINK